MSILYIGPNSGRESAHLKSRVTDNSRYSGSGTTSEKTAIKRSSKAVNPQPTPQPDPPIPPQPVIQKVFYTLTFPVISSEEQEIKKSYITQSFLVDSSS